MRVRMEDQKRDKMVEVHHKLEIDSASNVPEGEMHHREEWENACRVTH